jgi:signal transduction histidine kinase
MVHSHVLATRATHLGLLGGGLGALVIVALSIAFTMHLRRAVLKPLSVLTGAARRFGAGEFGARVGAVGRGELLALSQAFDRMAEELAERERRLVHNERMAAIGHLAAGVAHELNNPIGIIRGYLKTMGAKDDPQTLEEELQILDEEAAQCQRIAEDLLAYARPQVLRLERLRMKAFLDETLKRLGETPDARNARIEVNTEDFELLADPTRLRQVVLNLVLNAVQMSPEGAPVSVSGRADGDNYLLEVADRGPGIPVEDQGRIFEPFYTQRKGGSGLGLSVCLGIVRAHGGTITVESREGAGAVFRVSLPARPPEAERASGGVS